MSALKRKRIGLRTVWYTNELSLAEILKLLEAPGELLFKSHKARVRRVGSYVLKEGLFEKGKGLLKRTCQPWRYRRGWTASLALEAAGVAVPHAVAYVEEGLLGLRWHNVLISDYVDNAGHVGEYARDHVDEQDAPDFLNRLAKAVLSIEAADAYHADLKPHNILTTLGHDFTFIDLDAVRLNVKHTRKRRLANHLQLYAAFHGLWDDAVLRDFIGAMLPHDYDCEEWFERVRAMYTLQFRPQK